MTINNTILGIDPGSRITGYGIINQYNNNLHYITSGYINTKKKDFFNRLHIIYSNIEDIIIKFNPNYFAIEKIFVSKNANSAIKLGHARGVAIVVATNYNIPVFEYATKQIKQTIVGTGNAEKCQVKCMVCILLKINMKLQEDESDALSIAITHCYLNKQHNYINN